MRKILTALLFLSLIACLHPPAAWADDADLKAQVEELKARLEKLEGQTKESAGKPKAGGQCPAKPGISTEEAAKAAANPEPQGGIKCLEITGDVVGTGQGTLNNKPDQTGANIRADLLISAKPTASTQLGFHFLVSRGSGVNNAVQTFLGNPNANVQYNSDIPHLVEAWLQQGFLGERLVATLGILDPTVYFDTNRFANDETTQFMGTVFVNNPGIDWGGDANFYGPGVRLTANPAEWLGLSLGGFATQTQVATQTEPSLNNELVGFHGEFNRPFAILEADLKFRPWGREGNYRLYAWYNANKTSFTRWDTGKNEASWGGGGSFDQELTDNLGAFLRWSKQDESIRNLNWSVSGGLSAKGFMPGRADDTAGIGYAVGLISHELRQAQPCPHSTEQWVEAYYSAQVCPALHLGPDFQYVIGSCGSSANVYILGLRAQAAF
jgi:hypothetical protein